MNTKNYSSPWQYFVETEANGQSEDEAGKPLNSAEDVLAEPTDITLHITCTTLEWAQLIVETQTHNITPELLIRKKLFS